MALVSAAFYRLQNMRFHAFDSFQGLPDIGKNIIDQWKVGALATSEEEFLRLVNNLNLYTDKILIHRGYYNDSLNEAKQIGLGDIKAAFICVDCDYYESAVSVFNFVETFIQHGTVIYLDDVYAGFKEQANGGVLEAFKQFRMRSKFRYLEHMNIGWWGKSYIASI